MWYVIKKQFDKRKVGTEIELSESLAKKLIKRGLITSDKETQDGPATEAPQDGPAKKSNTELQKMKKEDLLAYYITEFQPSEDEIKVFEEKGKAEMVATLKQL